MTLGDILEGQGGVAEPWAAATRTMVVSAYGCWLSWLESTGTLDRQAAPGAQMMHDMLRLYLA